MLRPLAVTYVDRAARSDGTAADAQDGETRREYGDSYSGCLQAAVGGDICTSGKTSLGCMGSLTTAPSTRWQIWPLSTWLLWWGGGGIHDLCVVLKQRHVRLSRAAP
jgi:hypothetical protein